MSLTALHTLTNAGISAIDRDFLEALPPAGNLTALPAWVGDAGAMGDLEGLRDAITTQLAGRTALGPEDDPWIAEILHNHLADIGRRVAQNQRFWAWLAACELADVVRMRFRVGERAPNRKRFAGSLTDHALSRLWWGAELTWTPDDGYDHLPHLMRGQYRLDRLIKSPIMRHTPTMLGMLDALGEEDRWRVISQSCIRLGMMGSVLGYAALTREEFAELAREVVVDVRARLENA